VITVRFTFSAPEARRAMRYMALRSRGPTLMLAVGLAMLAVGAGTGRTVWLGVAGAELFAWVALIALLPMVSHGAGGGEQTLSFSEAGVLASNASGSQRFPWEHWRGWRRTGDLYLLRGAGSVFTWIPARALGDEDARFRELLTAQLGKPAGAARAIG
jgi:hypothetical protein